MGKSATRYVIAWMLNEKWLTLKTYQIALRLDIISQHTFTVVKILIKRTMLSAFFSWDVVYLYFFLTLTRKFD